MSTRAEILNGALFEGYEDFCADVVNAIVTHYRVSDPCVNMINRQPGEILSDPDDDKLYHVGGASGYPCDEILQASRSCDVIPDFKGVDFYSSCYGDYATIRGINEPGLGHRLTIGLDETTRTMVICDLGDIDVDFGLAPMARPTIKIFSAAGTIPASYDYIGITQPSAAFGINTFTISLNPTQEIVTTLLVDLASGHFFIIRSGANIELTDTDAEQAWMYLEPKINQTSTAGWIGLLIDVVSIVSEGDASAGAGYNALADLRVAGVTQFGIQRDGKIMTNQVNICSGATPGTVNGELPIYDQNGNLMGYIPIYDSIC